MKALILFSQETSAFQLTNTFLGIILCRTAYIAFMELKTRTCDIYAQKNLIHYFMSSKIATPVRVALVHCASPTHEQSRWLPNWHWHRAGPNTRTVATPVRVALAHCVSLTHELLLHRSEALAQSASKHKTREISQMFRHTSK